MGIAKPKERGVYKGRKPSIDVEKVRELKEGGGEGTTVIAKEMAIYFRLWSRTDI
jgi:hypothetical protein